jgi:hypothetical protein
MLRAGHDGDKELQDLGLWLMGNHPLMQGDALDRLDQADASGKVAPSNEHGTVGELVDLVVAQGSPPYKAAGSVVD